MRLTMLCLSVFELYSRWVTWKINFVFFFEDLNIRLLLNLWTKYIFKSYTVSLVVSVACVADIIYCQLVTFAKPCQYPGLPIPMCLDFPFSLIGKVTMVFLTGQLWHICKCQFTGGLEGVQNQDFCAVSQGDLTRSLVLSVAQASPLGINV